MLDFEAALARAEASVGVIPQTAVAPIAAACRAERYDAAELARAVVSAGNSAIPLVKALRQAVQQDDPQALPYVHLGSTSQDVIDSAVSLATRDALAPIEADLAQAAEALLDHVVRHAATPMLARTLMQPASVTSFGFKCAGWAAPLVRSAERLRGAARRALQVQLGGAVGTLAQMRGRGAAGRACASAWRRARRRNRGDGL